MSQLLLTYLTSLKQLAVTCDFKNFLEKALRDQLVCGLKSEAIQRYLLTESELNLTKALEIAQATEAATKQTLEIQGAASADTVYYVRSGTNKSTSRKAKKPCHRCGGRHSSHDCKFKDQQCNAYRKYGHIAKMCRNNGNNSSSRSSHKPSRKVQYVNDDVPELDISSDHDGKDDDICILSMGSKSSDGKIIILFIQYLMVNQLPWKWTQEPLGL